MVRSRTVLVLLVIAIIATSAITMNIVKQNNIVDQELTPQVKVGEGQEGDNQKSELSEEMKKIQEAYNKIELNYVENVDKKKIIDGAITGMVHALDDPHSSYMDAKQAEDFFKSLSDSFEGIGAEVTMENGNLTVISPIKGSPAEQAGIKPKDQIISVNGESLEGLNLFEAVSKIRGPKNTQAVLEIIRSGIEGKITITVTRDEIPIETVHYSTIPSEKGLLGKIEISDFGEKTAEEFKDALGKLEEQQINGLIIDVRGNPGGYLKSVLEIGSLVIPHNKIILQIEDKAGERMPYKSSLKEAKYPIVALINKGSASAAEILAAALKEAGNYPIIGETSYGKGTVQNPFQLSDGSNLKITIAKWLTPNGNWIHKKGVKPDIEISQPDYYHALSFPKDVHLKQDMNSAQVKNLQIILNGLGYKTQRTDGYFDENTGNAVRAFQKANRLEVTGEVANKTALLLQEKVAERINDPQTDIQLQVAIESLLKLIK